MTGRKKLAIGVYAALAVAVAGVAFVVLSGGDDASEPVTAPTSTMLPAGPPWPLTGVPSTSGPDGAPAPLDRPAVAVKISNSSAARPQVGINDADQVWEEQVEGISRLIAIFHSTDSTPVGPIRSARDSDVDLLGALGVPVFVWGGANQGVAARMAASPFPSFNVDPDAAADQYRDSERSRPDNLFIDGTAPFFAAGTGPAVAQFVYRAEGAEILGTPSAGAEVSWGGSDIGYLWDEGRAGWIRFQDGTPHVDSEDELVAPPNVVLLVTEYGSAPSDPRSPVAVTVGEGDATVLTAGHAITARWRRPSVDAPYEVVDPATGQPVELTAGRTWVALAPPTRSALIEEIRAAELRSLL
jgi:hypothetical protein